MCGCIYVVLFLLSQEQENGIYISPIYKIINIPEMSINVIKYYM